MSGGSSVTINTEEWANRVRPKARSQFPGVREGAIFAEWVLRENSGATASEVRSAAEAAGVTFDDRDLVFAKRFLGLPVSREERLAAVRACVEHRQEQHGEGDLLLVEPADGSYRELSEPPGEDSKAVLGVWVGEGRLSPPSNDQRKLIAILEGKGKTVETVGLDGTRRKVFVFGEFDSPSKDVLRRKEGNKEEARIDDDPAAVRTGVNAGAAFADAVAALKARLIPTVTDQDVADLEAVVRGAQENLPSDKESFVRDVKRMLAAGGLQLRISGSDASVQIGMKNGSIQLMVSRQGSRSFRSAELRVERVEPAPATTRQPT